MKYFIPLLLVMAASCALQKNKWPSGERTAFMDACIQPLVEIIDKSGSEKICSCALEKLESKYKSPENISENEARKAGEECATEYMSTH